MRVGVDFDNTIACYDDVFHRAALEGGLIPQHVGISKGAVRDYLRNLGREDAWVELQGHVYGARFREAKLFPGVCEFFMRCRESAVAACIISHRTRYPAAGPRYDLHDAAHEWLETNGFQDIPAFLELTREAKLNRICRERRSMFIDDLPELFAEPSFPMGVERVLFDPYELHAMPGVRVAKSWAEIESLTFCTAAAQIWT